MEEATHLATFMVAAEISWRVGNCSLQHMLQSPPDFQPWISLSVSYILCIAAVYLDLKNIEFFKSKPVRNIITVLHALDGITKVFLLHLLSRMVTGVKVYDKFSIAVQTTKTFLHHTASFYFISDENVIIMTSLWRFVSMNAHAALVLKDSLSPQTYDTIMWQATHARNIAMTAVLLLCFFDPQIRAGFAVSGVGHAAYLLVRLGPVFRLGSLYFPSEAEKRRWNDMTDYGRLMELFRVNLKMFSCISSPSQALRSSASFSTAQAQLSQQQQAHHSNDPSPSADDSLSEKELLDRVIEEGMRLKKKCKALRHSLVEVENKRAEDIMAYEKRLFELQGVHESNLNELKALHFIDLQAMKDALKAEYEHKDEAFYALHTQYNDLQQAHERYETEVSKQMGLYDSEIKELRNLVREMRSSLAEQADRHVEEKAKVASDWEKKLAKSQSEGDGRLKEMQQALESLCLDKESLRGQLETARRENEELLERTPVAPAPISAPPCKLVDRGVGEGSVGVNLSPCSVCSQAQTLYEALEYKYHAIVDENVYYKHENGRLEKQYALIKADLEKSRAETAGDMRGVLRSEREQKLTSELHLAKTQILELQQSLHDVLQAKEGIERGVRDVVRQNEGLAHENASLRRKVESSTVEAPLTSDGSVGGGDLGMQSTFSDKPSRRAHKKPLVK
eukprot:gene27281-32953_t